MRRPKGINTLITDADNTLYSWVDYIVPCLEAMVNTLNRITGIDKDAITTSIRKVFEQFNSNEYAFVLQQADVLQNLRQDFNWFQQNVINPTRYVFNRARLKHLQLYPGVRKAFRTLVDRRIRIIVLSDAPRFSAEQRLKHLGLSPYISALYALKSYPVPRESQLDQAVITRMKVGYYRSRIRTVVEMPLGFEKPNPAGLAYLLRREKINPEQTILVGDNPKKDIKLAQQFNIKDVWARYGILISPETKEKLKYYSAPSVHRRNVTMELEPQIVPTHTIDRFDQVLEFIL